MSELPSTKEELMIVINDAISVTVAVADAERRHAAALASARANDEKGHAAALANAERRHAERRHL